MAYVVMRPHRFVFNLGYSVAGADNTAGMTSVGLLFTSMFIELCFEFVVDVVALQVESTSGIRMSTFWSMWQKSECKLSHHMREREKSK